jgi:hypothetical protein
VRRWLSVLSVVGCGCVLTGAGLAAPPKTQLNVSEKCSSQLLPDNGVVLTTNLTLTNARRGRNVTVRILAGWNVEHLYPKARRALTVRLGPGETARRTVTLKLTSAPELWKALRASKKLSCASTKTYTIS